MKNKKISLFGLSAILLTLNVSAEECNFTTLIGELSQAREHQSFSQYFSPVILHEFRLAKYREHNAVELLQQGINGEDHPDFGKLLKQVMMGHIVRITQDKTLLNNFNIDSVSASADRFKGNIRELSNLSDYDFFNQYLTNSYGSTTLHYDFFKEAMISLSENIDPTNAHSCSYEVKTNKNRANFVQDISFNMDNDLLVSPSPLVAMFDYKAGAYTNEEYVDTSNGVDFYGMPAKLYPKGVEWWLLDEDAK